MYNVFYYFYQIYIMQYILHIISVVILSVDETKLFTFRQWFYWAKIITGSPYIIPCTVTDPRINVTLENDNKILSGEGSFITYDPKVGFSVPGNYTNLNRLICRARKGNLTQIKSVILNFER